MSLPRRRPAVSKTEGAPGGFEEGLSARAEMALAGLEVPKPGPPPPVLLVLSGLPGTGKSVLAWALAERHPFCVVASDLVRRAVFKARTYSPAEHAATYSTCRALICCLLAEGVWTIFDATNPTRRDRREALALAEPTGARAFHLQLQAPPEEVLQRLQARQTRETADFGSEAGPRVYLEMRKRFKLELVASAEILQNTGELGSVLERAEKLLGL